MQTFLMPFLGIINMLINIAGVACVFLFPPYPIVTLVTAFFTLLLVGFVELRKKYLLIEKKQKFFMSIFGLLIVMSVFFLTIGLAILIYLEEVQNKLLQQSRTFDHFMWQQSLNLTKNQISILSVGYYLGNFLTLSFYTRQYYQMFWVNHFIHIFRYLRTKIHHYNETLLSHLPKIKVTRQIRNEKCCLCLQGYEQFDEVTRVSCEHIFHRNCIRLWVVRSNACPLCRKRIVLY